MGYTRTKPKWGHLEPPTPTPTPRRPSKIVSFGHWMIKGRVTKFFARKVDKPEKGSHHFFNTLQFNHIYSLHVGK